MKARIKFRKYGAMKFIGHLDLMRYFQKAMRRSGIDIAYSEGFSPHQLMSFAAPLGVGVESNGEYMDIGLRTPISPLQAAEALNRVMADGVQILSFQMLPDTAKNAMSIVAAAEYTVRFREGHAPAEGWQQRLAAFYEREHIVILKKTKKSEAEVDIRPFIYNLSINGEEIRMLLAAGSAHNLKPDLVLSAFCAEEGHSLDNLSLCVTREEMYALSEQQPEAGVPALVTLGSFGEAL